MEKKGRIDTLVVPEGHRDVVFLLSESHVRKVVKYREYDVSENGYHNDDFAYLNYIWEDLE